MSKQSILALFGAAAISLSTLAVSYSGEARAAENKETVQLTKSSGLKRAASSNARRSFNQVRPESRVNEALRPSLAQPDRLRPPAQPGQW
jgi:D-aminopeptidase